MRHLDLTPETLATLLAKLDDLEERDARETLGSIFADLSKAEGWADVIDHEQGPGTDEANEIRAEVAALEAVIPWWLLPRR